MPISQRKTGALLSYAVIGANSAVTLLLTPFMISMMGKAEFGLYSLVTSVVAYLTVLDLGFGNAIIRYTAKFRAENKEKEEQEMLGLFLILYCAISLITLIAGIIFSFNLHVFFSSTMTLIELEKARTMMLLLVFNVAITFPFSLFVSVVAGYEKFIFQKSLILLRVALNAIAMAILLYFGYKAIAMVVSLTAFNVITLILNYFYSTYKINVKIRFGKFKISFFKEIFYYSLYIFLNAIMDRIYWSTGQFVLGAVVSTTAVAIFAVAIQLQHMYMAFSTAIAGVFLPKVTAMVSKQLPESEISDLFIRTGRIQFIIMAYALTGFILFGRSFIDIWIGPGFEDAFTITLLFFIPLTIPLIQNLGITILQARNQMKFRSILYVIIAIISLILQIPFAKKWGAIGCAISISGSLIIGQILVMNVYYYKRQGINIPLFWKEIIKMSMTPLAVGLIGYVTLIERSITNFSDLIFYAGIFTCTYIPCAWFFAMNTYEKSLITKPAMSLLKKLS
jgi:O-antigen/teichoic acid export membrane protein